MINWRPVPRKAKPKPRSLKTLKYSILRGILPIVYSYYSSVFSGNYN